MHCVDLGESFPTLFQRVFTCTENEPLEVWGKIIEYSILFLRRLTRAPGTSRAWRGGEKARTWRMLQVWRGLRPQTDRSGVLYRAAPFIWHRLCQLRGIERDTDDEVIRVSSGHPYLP